MKQTAVEWLGSQLSEYLQRIYASEIQQAIEMEKEQVVEAQEHGQSIYSDVIRCDKSKQYYNETFKK
jgi:hypothetical protein